MPNQINLDGMTLEDLEVLKKDVTARVKQIKSASKEGEKAEKEALALKAKETLEVGDVVNVKYKDVIVEAEVVKLNEKTFTAAFEIEGENIVSPRNYSLFVGMVS